MAEGICMVGVAEAESVLVALFVTTVDVCRMDMKRMAYSAADSNTYQSPQFSGNDTFLSYFELQDSRDHRIL